MSKNGFSPQLMLLEGREQPGSMLTTGLDASILAGAFLGDTLVKSSRPAILATQVPAKKADASDVVVQPLSHSLNTQSAGTIKQAETQSLDSVNGLFAPTAPKTFASLSETGVPSGFTNPVGGSGVDMRIPYNFYDGDFDGVNGFTSEKGTLVSSSNTWTDIRTRGGAGVTLTSAFGNFLIDNIGGGVPLPTTANFYMRGPGVMTTGNSCLGGSQFVAQLNVPVTVTLINAGPFFGAYELYKVDMTVLNSPVSIAGPAHNYFSIQPNGVGSGQFFVGTTSGANAVGQPLANNDDTWLTAPFFGIPCENWGVVLGDTATPWEVSVGVGGTIP